MRLVQKTFLASAILAIAIVALIGLARAFSPNDSDAAYTCLVLVAAVGVISLLSIGPFIARSVQVLRCRLQPGFRKELIKDLDSPWCAVRCKALQTLVDFHDAPVGAISCWPVRRCTELQLTTMEAVFGRWLEIHDRGPVPTKGALIDALFTFASEEEAVASPLTLPEPKNACPPNGVDRLTEIVKDAILDWNASAFTSDEPGQNEDAPLGQLPRAAFIAAMREKLADVVEQVADLVSVAPTARSLADQESRVGEMLADLRGEALALALEMREAQLPAPEPVTHPRFNAPHRSFPRWLLPDGPWPPAPEFPGRWVKKYRRMRRAGL
jgi:hypothetical protein